MTTTFDESDHPRATTGTFTDKPQTLPEVGLVRDIYRTRGADGLFRWTDPDLSDLTSTAIAEGEPGSGYLVDGPHSMTIRADYIEFAPRTVLVSITGDSPSITDVDSLTQQLDASRVVVGPASTNLTDGMKAGLEDSLKEHSRVAVQLITLTDRDRSWSALVVKATEG